MRILCFTAVVSMSKARVEARENGSQMRSTVPYHIAGSKDRAYAYSMSGAGLLLRRDPSPVFPTGAYMKTSIVYKIAEAHHPVETEVQKQLTKIEKLLKSYNEDMPQVHVACEKNGRGAEYSVSLNLW